MLAVILAAGRGSRMEGLGEGMNKCALPIQGVPPILHNARAALACGASRIRVVTGYARESVENALLPLRGAGVIGFAHNRLFDACGCNYSLARALADGVAGDAGQLLIVEGDSLLPVSSIRQAVGAGAENAVLLRGRDWIHPGRSVVAVGRDGMVNRFVYDQSHRNTMGGVELSGGEDVLGESMQVWFLAGESVARLAGELALYMEEAEQNPSRATHSGVHSLSGAKLGFAPRHAVRPCDWINLNTCADRQKAEECQWLLR